MRWNNRAHFFAVSAQLMRRILVDHARRRNMKRGAGIQHLSLEGTAIVGAGRSDDLVALDDAMQALGRIDPRKVQVVELRFFGGSERQGDGGSAQGLVGNRDARLEHCTCLAVSRDERCPVPNFCATTVRQ